MPLKKPSSSSKTEAPYQFSGKKPVCQIRNCEEPPESQFCPEHEKRFATQSPMTFHLPATYHSKKEKEKIEEAQGEHRPWSDCSPNYECVYRACLCERNQYNVMGFCCNYGFCYNACQGAHLFRLGNFLTRAKPLLQVAVFGKTSCSSVICSIYRIMIVVYRFIPREKNWNEHKVILEMKNQKKERLKAEKAEKKRKQEEGEDEDDQEEEEIFDEEEVAKVSSFDLEAKIDFYSALLNHEDDRSRTLRLMKKKFDQDSSE